MKIMNRKELIEALSSGKLKKIIEFRQSEEESKQGGYIGFAELNYMDAEKQILGDTWNMPLLGLSEVGNKWVQSGKYSNLSHEEFASLIVKYDYQVMAMGWYINHRFPEHSWAYEAPDPKMTPERKYQEILAYLKEIPEFYKKQTEEAKKNKKR